MHSWRGSSLLKPALVLAGTVTCTTEFFYCMYFILIHMLDLITDKKTRRVHYLYGVINIYMRDCEGSGSSHTYICIKRRKSKQSGLDHLLPLH